MFTWKPIYADIAKKLPEFENQNGLLVSLMKRLHDQGLKVTSVVDKDVGDVEVQMNEIDPFSFFANFNRGVTDDNRRAILAAIKDEWKLPSDLPQDFGGLPIMSSQNTWFMPYKKHREPHHVGLLWQFYLHCLQLHSADELDTNQFDACCALRRVAPASLTMGMFWSRPELWISVDKKNRAYASSLGVTRNVDSGADYVKWLKEVQQKTDKSTYEFSHQAHVNSLKDKAVPGDKGLKGPILHSDRNYWLLAPGKGAVLWDSWFVEGIGALGWNGMGDLLKYDSKESMAEYLPKVYEDAGPVHVAHMLWEFAHEMNPGDVVFAKRGLHKVCGWGIVAGDYQYDEGREPYYNVRKIDWKEGAEITMPTGSQLPLKTITQMTAKTSFLSHMAQQYGEIPGLQSFKAPPKPPWTDPLPPIHPPYVLSDAMADLFMPSDQVESCVELLKRKKNIVLQGAPGTGKTFVA